MSAVLSQARAVGMGYSADKRKRRRQHRQNVASLRRQFCPYDIVHWHATQARWLK